MRRRVVAGLLGLLAAAGLTGCASTPRAATAAEVSALRLALTSLAPTVRVEEAERVAACAYDYSRTLAVRYRVVRPALLHNFMVNTGFKRRGLCYEWAEDLLAQLRTLGLESLELRWGIARADSPREHNSVVVTAQSQPFERGIVLDPWRRGGWMVWSPVGVDRYPWVEGELEASPEAVTPR
jgi:hypothetical protein